MYLAFKQGIIEGGPETIGIAVDQKNVEVAKHWTRTDEYFQIINVMVNARKWQSLTEAQTQHTASGRQGRGRDVPQGISSAASPRSGARREGIRRHGLSSPISRRGANMAPSIIQALEPKSSGPARSPKSGRSVGGPLTRKPGILRAADSVAGNDAAVTRTDEAGWRPRGALDAMLRAYLAVTRRIVIVVYLRCSCSRFMVAINGLEDRRPRLLLGAFSWVQEVSILAAMWIYFFAYALIAKNEEYIRVDFVARLICRTRGRAATTSSRGWSRSYSRGWSSVFAVETSGSSALFTTSILVWPESLFVLPILIGAVDIVDHRDDPSLLAADRARSPPRRRIPGRHGVVAWRRC